MPQPALLAELLERGRHCTPLVGAHRGASTRAPENTLCAFRAALEDGAELIELDVHLSADGRLAVIHDDTTGRTTGVPGVVAALPMERLRALQATHSRAAADSAGQSSPYPADPARSDRLPADTGIPGLDDVFELAKGCLIVNVEIKGGGPRAVPAVARCAARHAMTERVIVSSFDPAVVRTASGEGTLLTGLLTDRPLPDPTAAARAVGASLLHAEHSLITPVLVEAVHAAGLGLLAWTVDEPAEMARLRDLGVDAILSDDPRLLSEMLAQQL